jgi:hypothetical protein
MATQGTEIIQGTLDVMILKTLSLQPLHGFGIAASGRRDLFLFI